MLKGSRDAVLHRMQPVSIHGQLFYDLHYRFADEPDSQMRVARVGGEALAPALQEGDHESTKGIEAHEGIETDRCHGEVRWLSFVVFDSLRIFVSCLRD